MIFSNPEENSEGGSLGVKHLYENFHNPDRILTLILPKSLIFLDIFLCKTGVHSDILYIKYIKKGVPVINTP